MSDPSPSSVAIGLTQARDRGTREKNLALHESLVQEAADQGADVVCLQELFATDYLPKTEDPSLFDKAEPVPGPTTEQVSEWAQALGVVIVAPVFEKRDPGVFHNAAVVVDADGSIAGTYRKTHIPHDPNFYEKYYFTPGDEGPLVVDTSAGRIGVMICWDQWFPETARLAALEGADVVFYPTCIGHADADEDVWESQREAWMLSQRAHALHNEMFVAAANRVGREANVTFWGNSFVAGPFGDVVDQAPVGEETVLVTEVDLDRIDETRKAWPFLRDRRPETYGDLTRRLVDDA